jgi:hypothetical protein
MRCIAPLASVIAVLLCAWPGAATAGLDSTKYKVRFKVERAEGLSQIRQGDRYRRTWRLVTPCSSPRHCKWHLYAERAQGGAERIRLRMAANGLRASKVVRRRCIYTAGWGRFRVGIRLRPTEETRSDSWRGIARFKGRFRYESIEPCGPPGLEVSRFTARRMT